MTPIRSNIFVWNLPNKINHGVIGVIKEKFRKTHDHINRQHLILRDQFLAIIFINNIIAYAT